LNEWEWQLLEEKTPVAAVEIDGREVCVGDRVRLRPRQGGDVLDIALAGQTAMVDSIEQDYDGKIHVCVVLDDDPGRDLGLLRQPGHRFFFETAEVESLPPEQGKVRTTIAQPKVLVAGIGNIFLGDDGFGVEVVKRVLAGPFPAHARVVDFGIRGFDLTYALQDGYDTVILVDAYPHGQPPGTVSLIEPDVNQLDAVNEAVVETHGMNPLMVLRMARAMGGNLKRVLLIGCEPATFGGEEGHMGLSPTVEAAIEGAVQMVLSTVRKVLQRDEVQP
jgi:hydrogenase maturation protease